MTFIWVTKTPCKKLCRIRRLPHTLWWRLRKCSVHEVVDTTRCSSWKKLLRVTAHVVRFFRRTGFARSLNLDTEELRHTEELWIKSIQYQSFPDKMCHMMSTAKTPVPPLVRQFNLYVDIRGLIRCKGRIQNSLLNPEVKTPLLLPSKHHVVELIIRETHDQILHNGINLTNTTGSNTRELRLE